MKTEDINKAWLQFLEVNDLKNKDVAAWLGMSLGAFQNSSARDRYRKLILKLAELDLEAVTVTCPHCLEMNLKDDGKKICDYCQEKLKAK